MRKALTYFRLQFKRSLKAVPAIFFTAVILLGCMFLLFLMINTINEDNSDEMLKVAVTGDYDDQYFSIGLAAMKHLDSSRFTVDIQEMEEEEARRLLKEGKLNGYAVIPEGFVDSVMTGENKKITLVTTNSSEELMGALVKEFMNEISDYLVETQNSITGMQDYLEANGKDEAVRGAVDDINLFYVNLVFKRDQLFEPVEIIASDTNLSQNAGYIVGLSIFLIMMFGITCSPLFVRSDMSLSQVLKSRGVKIPVQVIAEYITYLIMMLVCILILETIAVVAIDKSGLEVTEWSLHFVEDYEYFIIGLIPVVAMFSAMQYMIFLITDNFISGVLLQFIVAVCLGYLGGCLYPIAFFPEIIRKTAVFQPAGLAYRYMSDIMLINDSGLHLCMMLVYVLVFLGLSCLIFARRNASEK